MDYIPNTDEDRKEMMNHLGIDNHLVLFNDIRGKLFLNQPLKVKGFNSELEVRKHLENLANKNKTIKTNFLGAGAYYHYIPSTVDHVIRRNEFYTAYTPYQPEVSQGMLQAIYEFQTVIANLTGMDVANASMYDGSTAMAEAMLMMAAIKNKSEIIISSTIHPEYKEVLRTYATARNLTLKEIDFHLQDRNSGSTNIEMIENFVTNDTAGIIIQNPNFFGCIEDIKKIADIAHSKDALLTVGVVEATSLGILKSPGSLGADIVAGEGQAFGIPVSFGGPYLGLLACKQEFIRKIPGRLAGLTEDENNKRGFVLTLQAREQHIRREKATSNICTNQALCMLAALTHIVTLGKSGIRKLAELNINKANYTYKKITNVDNFFQVFGSPIYNEFVIRCRDKPENIINELGKNDIIPGLDIHKYYPNFEQLENSLLICVTETTPKSEIDRFVELLRKL
jgi:glycine dehydrogenase subunit 1